ncbi:MAG: VOC family protein [Flavobacteriales bacterium]|nr:VOC family protein [Flavobacteriales bacterium]
MKTINRLMINLCSEKLTESKAFYTTLFNFNINYDSDWFIHLTSESQNLELGIVDKNHETVPSHVQGKSDGFYLTFVVDNADEVHEIAQNQKMEVISAPEDTFYGQRRLLLKDPNGVVVDVSSPIPNFGG